jgi:hypothetical protein
LASDAAARNRRNPSELISSDRSKAMAPQQFFGDMLPCFSAKLGEVVGDRNLDWWQKNRFS